MQYREWVNTAAQELAQQLPAECSPRRLAELLLCHVCGHDRLTLITTPQLVLSSAQLAELEHLLARAIQHEPLAYLLGHKEFYGRDFAVSPATLIPRPETEHLIEAALELLPQQKVRFVDLGTGSGCVAISLAAERPQWQGLAVDISPQALNVAQSNAKKWGVNLVFACADMADSAAVAQAAAQLFGKPDDPEIASEGQKEASEGQKEASEGPEIASEGQKEASEAQKEIPEAQKEIPEAQKEIPEGQKETPEAQKETPEGQKEASEGQKETSEGQKETSEAHKEIPEGQKETPEGQKEASEGPQNTTDPKRALYQKNAPGAKRAPYQPETLGEPPAPYFALDLVVSNPPYISEAAYQGLEANVRCFEPKLALVPGQTGLELPLAVVNTAAKLLRPGAWLLMEHGFDQGLACRQLCLPDQWEEVRTGSDLSGQARFLIARKKGPSCAS